jgi:hypothetical protein
MKQRKSPRRMNSVAVIATTVSIERAARLARFR